ncbi:MAG: hypothetical protein V1913_06975 [Fibrobacterota bacterium]
MKLKDIFLVGGITVACFPIVLVLTMYATGFLNVSFGNKVKKEEPKPTIEVIKYTPYQESLAVLHSKSFQALESQRKEIDAKEKRMAEDEARLQELKKDITRRTDDLEKTKARLEEIVKQSSVIEERRIKQLAQIYGSMRAEEAAPILFTLKDDLIVQLLRRIGDDRQKAKLMTSMGSLSKERAGKISKMMTEIKVKG